MGHEEEVAEARETVAVFCGSEEERNGSLSPRAVSDYILQNKEDSIPIAVASGLNRSFWYCFKAFI